MSSRSGMGAGLGDAYAVSNSEIAGSGHSAHLPLEADVDLALDKGPLFRGSEHGE